MKLSEEQRVRVGIEIHRQLDTEHKLFCSCPTDFGDSQPEMTFLRRLRPTQSELGQVDQAALFEFQRGRSILYEADQKTSCLVEMDEEPPRNLNPEAVAICLTAALLLNAKPVDEVHAMRKIVIDGSNTTGFQRTCVVALDGFLKVGQKEVPILQISLEEDAARKTGQSADAVGYRIDRLGVPLIEVTTAPALYSAAEVEEVALAIGTILRATRKVKRGLGSIRQDLNISTPGGALVEIKGVQELELLGRAVEIELGRQQALLQIREELTRRGVKAESMEPKYVDVSSIFTQTKSHVIRKALEQNGVVLALRLPRFGGLLGKELAPGLRLGTEMSSRASFWGGVGGIFHSDELPGRNITEEEVRSVNELLRLEPMDAFVLVADERSKAERALSAVFDRAVEATVGVPEETRMAMPDGTSRYMRPRPGAARLYPETDVPPLPITDAWIARIRETLPETSAKVMDRLMSKYALNDKLAKQLVDSDYLELFETIASSSKVPASFIATVLTENCKSLEREGFPVSEVPNTKIQAMFKLVDEGKVAKEAIVDLIKWQTRNMGREPREGLKELGLHMLSEQELEAVIDKHIEKNRRLLAEKGAGAFSSLMGSIMSEVRGLTDAKMVSEKLKSRIANATRKGS